MPDMFDENQDLNVIRYYLLWTYSEWTLFMYVILCQKRNATSNIFSKYEFSQSLRDWDINTWSCKNPVQQLTVNALVDRGSLQQQKIATSGYFTWETGPWQQEKQHQMYQVSDEYRHRQSETVSVKTAYAPEVLTLTQYWDVRIDLQGYDGATEWGAGTYKTWGESSSAMNQNSCCIKEMTRRVSTDARMRGSQRTAFLRSKISAEEVSCCGCHILRNSTGAHPRQS